MLETRLPGKSRYEFVFYPWVRKTPMEKGMALHSSILAWRISWTEEPGGLQSVGHKELDTTEQLTHTHAYTHTRTYTYMHAHTHAHTHPHTYPHTRSTYTHAHNTYPPTHTRTHTHTHTHTHPHAHTHTHTHTQVHHSRAIFYHLCNCCDVHYKSYLQKCLYPPAAH